MTTSKKTPFNSNEFKDKINKVFNFLIDIFGIAIHAGINVVMFFWTIFISTLLAFSTIVSKIFVTFNLELWAGVWVFATVMICVATIGGWWYMGGVASLALNRMFNAQLDYFTCSLISAIVGTLLNGQQVKTSLWVMNKNAAAIWHKNDGGKISVEAAATDFSKFLTAREKRSTQLGMFAEAIIQFCYAILLNLNIFMGAAYILACIKLPEMFILYTVTQLNAVKMGIYGQK